MNMKVPCLDCPDRHLGCHSSCERYIHYQRRHQEVKEQIYNAKAVENEWWMFRNEAKEKIIRSKGTKI